MAPRTAILRWERGARQSKLITDLVDGILSIHTSRMAYHEEETSVRTSTALWHAQQPDVICPCQYLWNARSSSQYLWNARVVRLPGFNLLAYWQLIVRTSNTTAPYIDSQLKRVLNRLTKLLHDTVTFYNELAPNLQRKYSIRTVYVQYAYSIRTVYVVKYHSIR